jgi:hypothetical protein
VGPRICLNHSSYIAVFMVTIGLRLTLSGANALSKPLKVNVLPFVVALRIRWFFFYGVEPGGPRLCLNRSKINV